MHLSTHNWMRAEPIETTLERIARLGYESIEISGEPGQYALGTVKQALDTFGIRCWGSVTLTLGERNLAAKDADQRKRTVKYMQSVVQFVHDLGGEIVSVVPATVGKITPDGTPEEEWDWVVEGLREVYTLSQDLGVRLAIEPLNRFETYFLNRADQALVLADAVGPECGVCLDFFHMNIEEQDILGAIRAVGPRLFDVHVADSNRLPPGMGRLDWESIVATLKDIGYTGALTAEAVAPVDRTPASPWPWQVETNPVDISPEQKKFIEDHGSSLLSEEFYTMLAEKTAEKILPMIGKST